MRILVVLLAFCVFAFSNALTCEQEKERFTVALVKNSLQYPDKPEQNVMALKMFLVAEGVDKKCQQNINQIAADVINKAADILEGK